MGWLLLGKQQNKRKKTRKTATAQSAKTAAPWDPARTMLAIKTIGAVALVAIVIGGWNLSYNLLSQYIGRNHSAPLEPSQVTLADPPGWMSQGVRQQIKQAVVDNVSPDPLNGYSLSQAATALANVSWVKQVTQLRRNSNGDIKITARYRKPAAVVKYRRGFHLVSIQGVELVAKPYQQSQISELGLPVIVGVLSAPPLDAGDQWEDASLMAGLNLIRVLKNKRFFNQIKAIDVSRRDARGRQRLMIYAVDGGQIAWGYAPKIKQEIEPDTAVKIARLRRIAQVYNGSIDAGAKQVQIYGATIQTQDAPLRHWKAKYQDN